MALDTLKASLRVALSVTGKRTTTGVGPRTSTQFFEKVTTLTTGVGAGQGNEAYMAIRSLAGGATENIDLSAALTNIIGDLTVTVARVKEIWVWLLSDGEKVGPSGNQVTGTACSSITFGGHATQAWQAGFGAANDTWTVHNGGLFLATRPDSTGWVVTGGSVDLIKVVNNSATIAAKYVLILIMAAT